MEWIGTYILCAAITAFVFGWANTKAGPHALSGKAHLGWSIVWPLAIAIVVIGVAGELGRKLGGTKPQRPIA